MDQGASYQSVTGTSPDLPEDSELLCLVFQLDTAAVLSSGLAVFMAQGNV